MVRSAQSMAALRIGWTGRQWPQIVAAGTVVQRCMGIAEAPPAAYCRPCPSHTAENLEGPAAAGFAPAVAAVVVDADDVAAAAVVVVRAVLCVHARTRTGTADLHLELTLLTSAEGCTSFEHHTHSFRSRTYLSVYPFQVSCRLDPVSVRLAGIDRN